MLKNKTIQVFDADNIKIGGLITFCHTQPDDEGEAENGYSVNGIVVQVNEDKIRILIQNGETASIKVNHILDDKVRILGYTEKLNTICGVPTNY